MGVSVHFKHILVLSLVLAYGSVKSQGSISFTDSRAAPTTPNNYNLKFEPHFKVNSVLGLPYGSNPYYSLLGFRGWADDSGGKGHELAFSNHGKIYWRSGYDNSGWENWRQLAVTDESGNLALNGHFSSELNANEGGSISLINPLKTHSEMSMRWSIYNMTGVYGNSLQFWSYNYDSSIMGPRMVLADNGNVGIGIVNPQDKLAVSGNIRAKEIKVETTNWPDYVFDEDYRNLGLDELERYIKINKHLPDMPSASEVEKEGIALGEMNKTLLKKIEELTLHLINKEKSMIGLQVKLEENQRELLDFKKEFKALKTYLIKQNQYEK